MQIQALERSSACIPVLFKRPDVPSGYLVHAACWDIFVRASHQEPINLECLFDICSSLPERAFFIHGLDHHSWTDEWPTKYTVPLKQVFDIGEGLNLPACYLNPGVLPAVQKVVDENSFRLAGQRIAIESPALRLSGKPDCFSLLPVEILQRILILLPSKDVLNLKIASSIVATIALPNSFWASRFHGYREYGHIIEAHNCETSSHNWEGVYFALRARKTEGTLENRRCIWLLALSIHGFMSRLSQSTCNGVPMAFGPQGNGLNPFEPLNYWYDDHWMLAIGARKSLSDEPQLGCTCIRRRQITLTGGIAAIFVSFIRLYGMLYLSGFRFQHHDGTNTKLGYIFARNEVLLAAEDLWNSTSQIHISKFDFGVDGIGIFSLSVRTTGGRMSQWEGHPSAPRFHTRVHLDTGFSPMRKLAAEFDVCLISPTLEPHGDTDLRCK
jgi:hypothetical protein